MNEEAVVVLQELLQKQPFNLRAMEQIASTYLETALYDPSEAEHYYAMACDVIVSGYQQVYGKAFMLLIVPSRLPDIHARIFAGRALARYQQHKYEKAVDDLDWALYLRPDKNTFKELKFNALYQSGQQQKAIDFAIAEQMDVNITESL